MTEFLEFTVDKFTFKIAMDRLYNTEGLWAKPEENHIRIGLSDFIQQHNGDVAFAEVKAAGTEIIFDEEIATIETIKVNISLPSPVTGKIVEVNPTMSTAPEAINQDPYGTGWLALVQTVDWEADKARLLDPHAYFAKMKKEAEQEAGKG